MNPDTNEMGRREEAGWWLRTAESDLEAGRTLMESGQHHHCAFHSQQAAEKALKSVLTLRGESYRTHACTELVDVLREAGQSVPDDLANAGRRLDLHYVQSRYPNGLGGDPTEYYDREIADESVELASHFLEFARTRLGEGP